MTTLKDHQAAMVDLLANGSALSSSGSRLAHALHDVLAHLNNTNVALEAHTERRIDATTPGLNDALLAADVQVLRKPRAKIRSENEQKILQLENTIRQLRGRVSLLLSENEALEQEVMSLRKEFHCLPELPEQAGCRKDDTQLPDDGWIEWGGGACPVPVYEVVEIKVRDGSYLGHPVKAGYSRWYHRPDGMDIIAYRIVGEPK